MQPNLRAMEIAGVVEAALSALCAAIMLAACLLSVRHAQRGSHQSAIVQILAALSFSDLLGSAVWCAGCFLRVWVPDFDGEKDFLLEFAVGCFAVEASCLWTCAPADRTRGPHTGPRRCSRWN